MSIQAEIEARRPRLSPSLARVGALLQQEPARALTSTITELAEARDTSVASVVRFCRAIGFSGYADLRVGLAQELGKESAQFADHAGYGGEIAETDTLPELAAKISLLEILAIQETIDSLDYEVLTAAVDRLDAAERILLYGVGASQLVAQDLGHKLLRIGRNAFVPSDSHEALAIAVLAPERTIAVAFSNLGETRETLRFLTAAGQAGATTVGITSSRGSTITTVAGSCLYTAVRETPFRAAAMVSRMAQLAVVDCLFAGVAQRRYGQTVAALRSTREATQDLG